MCEMPRNGQIVCHSTSHFISDLEIRKMNRCTSIDIRNVLPSLWSKLKLVVILPTNFKIELKFPAIQCFMLTTVNTFHHINIMKCFMCQMAGGNSGISAE